MRLPSRSNNPTPKAGFERLDLARQGRLTDIQHLRRARDAQALGHRDKSAQALEIDQAHICSICIKKRGSFALDASINFRQWLEGWSGLRRGPTPLWRLPQLAEQLQLACVSMRAR
jgi:hypothetical protein